MYPHNGQTGDSPPPPPLKLHDLQILLMLINNYPDKRYSLIYNNKILMLL